MTKEEIEAQIQAELEKIQKAENDLQAKLDLVAKLQAKLAEVNSKPQKIRVEDGKSYYFFSENLTIWETADVRKKTDDQRFESGNYFRSQEDIDKVLKVIKSYITLYGAMQAEPDSQVMSRTASTPDTVMFAIDNGELVKQTYATESVSFSPIKATPANADFIIEHFKPQLLTFLSGGLL